MFANIIEVSTVSNIVAVKFLGIAQQKRELSDLLIMYGVGKGPVKGRN